MSGVVKRSMTIRGHRTSVSLEQPFFDEGRLKLTMALARLTLGE
jgi:predicted DNA-binding ribbon-helix-helix protein